MLRALTACCCGDQDSNEGPYGGSGDESRLIHNGSAGRLPRYGSNDRMAPNGSSTLSNGHSNPHTPTDMDTEQAILQKILDHAEHKSIDVSALDNPGPTQDFTTRATKYDDVIKGKVPPPGGQGGKQSAAQQQNNPSVFGLLTSLKPASRCLLEDSGSHVKELLSADPISEEHLDHVRRLATDASHAIQEGFRVDHQEDLVVQLNPSLLGD